MFIRACGVTWIAQSASVMASDEKILELKPLRLPVSWGSNPHRLMAMRFEVRKFSRIFFSSQAHNT